MDHHSFDSFDVWELDFKLMKWPELKVEAILVCDLENISRRLRFIVNYRFSKTILMMKKNTCEDVQFIVQL